MRSSQFVKVMPLLALVCLSCISDVPSPGSGLPRSDRNVAMIVYWDVANGVQSIEGINTALDEINPFYYAFDDKGRVVENSPGIETVWPLASIIRSGRFRTIPTIVNDQIYPDGANKQWQ